MGVVAKDLGRDRASLRVTVTHANEQPKRFAKNVMKISLRILKNVILLPKRFESIDRSYVNP